MEVPVGEVPAGSDTGAECYSDAADEVQRSYTSLAFSPYIEEV